MRTKIGVLVVLGLSLLVLYLHATRPSPAQEPPPKEKKPKADKGPPDEAERVVKGVEKALKVPETERDKLLKEMRKNYPQAQTALANGAGSADEVDLWFDLLTEGRGVWVYVGIPKKPLREFFERAAGRLGVASGEITRQQFLAYAREYLVEGASPAWKSSAGSGPQAEAEKTFRELDRDRDGLLSHDETSAALRAERARWDANGDGFIDRDEYLAYFQGRMNKVLAEHAGGSPTSAPPKEGAEASAYRPGRLPPGMPGWFGQLDGDRDSQLGVYEWKRSGRSFDEFRRMDRNDDGFLTAEELKRYLAPPGQN